MNFIRRSTALLIMLHLAVISYSQDLNQNSQNVQIDIPEVAIMDLEAASGTSIVLNIDAPEDAGDPVSFEHAVDSSIWINYSSIRGSANEPSRKITAKIISGTVPGGMRLKVSASNDVGQGGGDMGVNTGEHILNGNSKNIIRNIRSCYTGDGAGKGHYLKYVLELKPGNNKYRQLDFDDATTLTILYTITDE
ncbi:MAG: hypothetical protein GC181_07865 [Bacteroidetes bacterium]|nr:hypothetical protein [Bacteroidota bacterium]